MLTRVILLLSLISICSGRIYDFGKSTTNILSENAGALSTYFWDDAKDDFNISFAGNGLFKIINYNIDKGSIKELYSHVSSVDEAYVSAGSIIGGYIDPSDESSCIIVLEGNELASYSFTEQNFFIHNDEVYSFYNGDFFKCQNGGSGYDCTDKVNLGLGIGEETSSYKIINDKYLSFIYGKSTGEAKYMVLNLDNHQELKDIQLSVQQNQYSDIAFNDEYLLFSIDKIIYLYSFSSPYSFDSFTIVDSIIEDNSIIACTFDKNTGLIYYATTNQIVCADPKDFKLSSTSRYNLPTEIDSSPNDYTRRRGDLFIHRSGRLFFSFLYKSVSGEHNPALLSIEVDNLTLYSDYNITGCLDNPTHRVWSLKEGKCKLKMSPSVQEDCNQLKCIEDKPAVLEKIEPSTGSTEGGTVVSVYMTGLNLTNISKESIKIKLVSEEISTTTDITKTYEDGTYTVIDFETPSLAKGSYVIVVHVNNNPVHNSLSDNKQFNFYNCSDMTDCTSCTTHSTKTEYESECKWCALDNKCKAHNCEHGTGRTLGNCPSFALYPDQFSAPGEETELLFSLKGEEGVEGVKYYCHSDGNSSYGEEGTLANNILTCKLPIVNTDVNVSVSTTVGDSTEKIFYAQSENPLRQAVCDTYNDCAECIGYSHCRWFFNTSAEDFRCGHKDAYDPSYAYEVCPAVTAIEPPSVEFWSYDKSPIPISVSLNGNIPSDTTYNCTFGEGENMVVVEGTWVDENTVSCTIPENTITTGGQKLGVGVVVGKGNSEPKYFYSLQCNSTKKVSECVQGEKNYDGLCGWCFADNTCSSTCDTECWLNDGFPKITSIEPAYFNLADGTKYTVTGSGFVPSKCGPELQCVLSDATTGNVINTTDAIYKSNNEIYCEFGALVDDDDEDESIIVISGGGDEDDSDEGSGSGKNSVRRRHVATITKKEKKINLRAAATGNSYAVSIKDKKGDTTYDLSYTGATFTGIYCAGKKTCFDCTYSSESGNESNNLFSTEYCRWDVLSGKCTTRSDDQGYYVERGSSTCPAITGFTPAEADAGSEVTIIGEGFVDSERIIISIIDKATGAEVERIAKENYTRHNETHISFVFPDLPPGSYGVSLVTDQGTVAANNVAELSRPKEDDGDDSLTTIIIIVVVVIVVIIVACIVAIFFVHRHASKNGLAGFDFDIKNEPDYMRFKFATSLTNGPKLDKGLAGLIPLLQDPAIACAICDATQSTERDKVTNSLVYVQASGACVLPFITTLINEEVPRTPNEKQLFRGDGVISKAFRAYSKIVGLRYLWLTLGRVLNEIDYLARMQDKTVAAARERRQQQQQSGDCELTEGAGGSAGDISDESAISILDTEVDPSKLAEGANVEAKIHLLYQRCSIVLDPILKSEGNMPAVIRWILHTIYQKVGEVFPGSEHIGIAGTFFLRFICPSITIPHTYGLLKEPPIEPLQRQLTLIAKVLQNTANNCNFGRKEPFMVGLNGFVGSNCIHVQNFMDKISECKDGMPTEEKQEIPQDVINASVLFMKGHIANNLKKLGPAMEQRGVGDRYQEIADIVSQ